MGNIKMKTKGVDKLLKNLKKLEKEQTYPLKDIITDYFIQTHSKLSSLNEIFDLAGIENDDDYPNKREELDKIIQENSNFDSWKSFSEKAASLFMKKKIFG